MPKKFPKNHVMMSPAKRMAENVIMIVLIIGKKKVTALTMIKGKLSKKYSC
jgi:hypothetical protein